MNELALLLYTDCSFSSVPTADDLKPPPYSECAQSDEADAPRPAHHAPLPLSEGGDSSSISEAPPPYTPSPTTPANQGSPASHNQSHLENRPT